MTFFIPRDSRSLKICLYNDLINARSSIFIATYWLTHSTIISAIKIAARREVDVTVIVDSSTPDLLSLQAELSRNFINLLVSDAKPVLMHQKILIIDSSITWTGSANMTQAGLETNYENILRIESNDIAMNNINNLRVLADKLQSNDSISQCFANQKIYNSKANERNLYLRPVSEYQKRLLYEFGINANGLDYAEAYKLIGIVKSIR